jgi:hydroxypyruvate reductase
VRGQGRGGRNVEFLLSLLIGLRSVAGVSAIAADTDGIDGTEDNAGAMIDQSSLDRARSLGLSAADFLRRNDGYSFFQATGDLVVTGPTFTNVNDFRAIVIDAPSPSQERLSR